MEPSLSQRILCKSCKQPFTPRACPSDVASGRGVYCSVKCVREGRRVLPKTFNCLNCKADFPNRFGKFKKYCSKKCADEGRIGRFCRENNPNWQGGKVFKRYRENTSGDYTKWHAAVLKRDGYKCLECGSKKKLQVDHIKIWVTHPHLRYDIKNGQTLCDPCHKMKTKLDMSVHFSVLHALKGLIKEGKVVRREIIKDGYKTYQYKATPC